MKCCVKSSLPPVAGLLDQYSAAAVVYQTGVSAAQALDALQLPVLLPAIIQYLNANPAIKAQFKAALT